MEYEERVKKLSGFQAAVRTVLHRQLDIITARIKETEMVLATK